MSMTITGGDHRKAEKVARDLVKDLTVVDVDWTVVEGMEGKGEERLCTAIRDNFKTNERQLWQLYDKLTEALDGELLKMFTDFNDLRIQSCTVRQHSSFLLGWAAAMRLLGVDEKKGGKR